MRRPQPSGPVNWTVSGGGYRHVWVHESGSLFFGTAKESANGEGGVQSIGGAVVDVTNLAVPQEPAGNLEPANDKHRAHR
jgi:hypothetical protein